MDCNGQYYWGVVNVEISSVYLVDVQSGVEVEEVFTPTSQTIKAFGGDKALFDFIAEVVDTKHEQTVQRISKITKYKFGGTVEYFDLEFTDGNLKLVSKGVASQEPVVEIQGGEPVQEVLPQ